VTGPLQRLNALPLDDLAAALSKCCGCAQWVAEMVRRRPYASASALREAAESAWLAVDDTALRTSLSAFITAVPLDGDEGTRAAAEMALRLYRQRFGYRFLTVTDNLSADELLMLVRIRLGHDEGPELRRSRGEFVRLTRLRLDQLLSDAG
jgi:2-oxo-4-hydroxy-4-carboxy--5-ureidoimidazoline (OHCU) decarboxylase